MRLIFTLFAILLCGIAGAQPFGQSQNNWNGISGDRTGQHQNTPAHKRDTLPGEVIVVPVVVHVLYNTSDQNISDQRIIDQINSLNRDYRRRNADTVNTPAAFRDRAADVQIVFALAQRDPHGNKTTGIIRKYTKTKMFMPDDEMKFSAKGGDDAWDATKYLNIWVCNIFGRLLGYTPMPGGDPKTDGVVIQYSVFGHGNGLSGPFNLGRTLTHEVGHWLGLKHIWGDSECGDDGIDDTPRQQSANTGHNVFPKISACSEDANGDMFMNFMDFSDDADMNMFTIGQKKAMRAQFALGGDRNSLLVSDALNINGIEEALQDKDWEEVVRLYPNPTVDYVIVEGRSLNDINGKYLKLYDMQGKLILSKRIQDERTRIDMNGLPGGLYMLSLEDMGERKMFKIVKTASGFSH
ncbi:MAG: T9SS type A sorting domain-containing protein [Chitinophagaceae bacterium]|nr:T9SS type A sorting domain-containing protein [Chitinophagaceae bacterium]